jgi:hypothetical protein
MDVIRPDEDEPADDESKLIGVDEIAFTLPLTEPELKLTYTALHGLLDDLGHDEAELVEIVRGVLDKLPDEHSIRAITIP